MTTTMDRRRLQSAGADYPYHPYLRGLLSVPAGVLFIVSALGNWGWGPLKSPWAFVGVVLVLALVCAAINRYYNDNYGRVTPSRTQQVKAGAAAGAGVVLMSASPPCCAATPRGRSTSRSTRSPSPSRC
jgi:hypothetical protein